MAYDPYRDDRRSIRLKGYDYTRSGTYFVTICVDSREHLLGEVAAGKMSLGRFGEIARDEWYRIARIRPEIGLDAFVVMPNHVHGVLLIRKDAGGKGHVGAHGRAPLQRSPRSLGSLIAGYKAATTRQINAIQGTPGQRFWQRNFYERIIRSRDELWRVRQYIRQNPSKWNEDPENPSAVEAAREPPS